MMKNITFRLDDMLIRRAREKAAGEGTTVNELFRQWLADYAGDETAESEYHALMNRLGYARAGRKFTREEMNERR